MDLLHCHRLGQVAWLVDVGAFEHGDVVRQQLQRQGGGAYCPKGSRIELELGLNIGFDPVFFQLKRDSKGTMIIGLLFIMTGLAILVILTSNLTNPGKGTITYAASFYAFTIWIGLGVIQLIRWAQRNSKGYLPCRTGLHRHPSFLWP